MATLTDLPRELRHEILLATVKLDDRPIVGQAWPKTCMVLLQVCRVIQYDMLWVIKTWVPLWHLRRPMDLRKPPALTVDGTVYKPASHRICIKLFHEVDIRNVRNTFDRYPAGMYPISHVEPWCNAVPGLPMDIEVISLDVTPVSESMSEHPTALEKYRFQIHIAR
jgi:hypothetical protein